MGSPSYPVSRGKIRKENTRRFSGGRCRQKSARLLEAPMQDRGIFCDKSLFFLSEKHKPLSKKTHGNGGENIHHGMLLDKNHGKADDAAPEGDGGLCPAGHPLFPEPGGGDAQGIAHMKRGADSGIGIKGIKKGHQPRQRIFPGKHLRPQILSVWKKNINKMEWILKHENYLTVKQNSFSMLKIKT